LACGTDRLATRPDLTKGPITRTLLLFALPVLGGNALQALNGGVNQFWVSHSLGVSAVTAIGNANIVMMLMLGVISGVSMAANILIAQSVGSGDLARVKRVMGTSVTFFIVLSVLVAVAGYFASPSILALMGTPAESVAEAEIYLRIVFLAMPFMYFFAFLQMAQRGVGDSRTPFWFMVLAVGIDVVLNPLLIRGIGPFPRLDIAGSAVSTFVAQGPSLALKIRTAREVDTPWAWRNTMISRMTFWSAQPEVIFEARFLPMPSTSSRRAGVCSMMSKTSVPKAATSRPA